MYDYSSVAVHFFPVFKYVAALLLLFIVLPKFIILKKNKFSEGNFYGYLFDTILLFILLSYVLIFSKLYELLAVIGLLIILIYYVFSRKKGQASLNEILHNFKIWVFDFWDGLIKPISRKAILTHWWEQLSKLLKHNYRYVFLAITLYGFAAWLRFYDVFVHAALPLSDSYVTLAWMKYINQRMLFHDGLYPQGFHIFLSLLSKFSATNPLFILKYTGPINAMLIIGSVWFFIYKVTGSKSSGYFGVVVYGCTGLYFDTDFVRQVATNSQEFAMLFILPTLWYLIQYFEEKDVNYLLMAFSGLSVIGLVHSLIFAYVVLLSCAIMIARIIVDGSKAFKPALLTMGAGLVATVISLLPLGLGYLLGFLPHESSLEYLNRISERLQLTPIGVRETLFLIGMGATLIFIALPKLEVVIRKRLFTVLLIFGAVAALYWVIPVITQSVLIESRKSILLILFLAVGSGICHALLIKPFERFDPNCFIGIALTFLGFVIIVGTLKPMPFIPRKMESDTHVEQYLRINENFNPSEWMIVSQEEEYALVLGTGFHMFVRDFIRDFSTSSKLLKYKDEKSNRNIKIPDVFIYYEKNIFKSEYVEMKEVYDRREAERPNLKKWLEAYKKSTGNLQVYFEDEDLIIYWIHTPFTKEENYKEIWEY